MTRANYDDECDGWALIRWRGAVNASIKGKRGQKLLHELATGMDAMPAKRLIANELVTAGDFCALGVVGLNRGLDMAEIDPEDSAEVAKQFDIADALAREIVFVNDELGPWKGETPEQRWVRVRAWVASNTGATP